MSQHEHHPAAPPPVSPQPAVSAPTRAFEIKGSTFSLLAVCLKTARVREIELELERQMGKLPGFFAGEPLVLDLKDVPDGEAIVLPALVELFTARKLALLGVCNAAQALQEAALAAGLPVLAGSAPGQRRAARAEPVKAEAPAPKPAVAPRAAARIVDKPVRTGQRVFARDGDLTVLAAVNAGAEVLASGSIHVYAPLRGRALAGIDGDTTARIFTRCLEAELVAIAGCYRLLDEDLDLRGKPAQVYLEEERLFIAPL